MKGLLSKNRREYIIWHLSHFVVITELKTLFSYISTNNSNYTINQGIYFRLTKSNLQPESILTISGTPILFPGDPDKPFYTMEQGSLIFHHDLLKSAFYLLSGYQETIPGKLDKHQRFPWDRSIQKKLGITKRALVNEYFEIILAGLQQYCQYHNLPFKRKKAFDTFGLWLSHDIDQVDKYTLNEFIFQTKNVLGLAQNKFAQKHKWKLFFEHAVHTFFTRKNPYWNFRYLLDIEKKHRLPATYFFLPKRKKHHDAYYDLSEKRIKSAMQLIDDAGGKIGLHGTVDSSHSTEALKEDLEKLKKSSPQPIRGMRQHRLMYQRKTTPKLHDEVAFQYDASLGFAEHEGFRNSYCHPFKLYNFEKEQPYNTWEIPLVVMDGTLFQYRGYTMEHAMETCMDLAAEIKKHHGVFSLLWHNSFFDEVRFPGITKFYENLLKNLVEAEAKAYIPLNSL